MTEVERLARFVNLFVDHTQIVQLERLRCGIWGTDDTWGRVRTYRGIHEEAGMQR